MTKNINIQILSTYASMIDMPCVIEIKNLMKKTKTKSKIKQKTSEIACDETKNISENINPQVVQSLTTRQAKGFI